MSQWMRRMLALKLKTLKFIDQISGNIKDVVNEAESEAIEINTNTLSVNINKVDHAGTTLYLKLMGLSPELNHEIARLKGMHTFKMPEEE